MFAFAQCKCTLCKWEASPRYLVSIYIWTVLKVETIHFSNYDYQVVLKSVLQAKICLGFAEGDWKVSVTTEESGKHGNVVMVAYGDKGNSGQIMLGKCGNKKLFNAGNVDEFKVCFPASPSSVSTLFLKI